MGMAKTRWASLVWCGVFSWSLFGPGDLTAQPASQTGWQQIDSGVEASLRGLSVVDTKTVWCSGSDGTVIRTEDGGQTWANVSVAQAPELDFRVPDSIFKLLTGFPSSRKLILMFWAQN